MKAFYHIIAFIILISNNLYIFSQPKESISTRDKIYYGGTFGLALGTYTQIELSPYIGYRLIPSWSVGTGPIFQYYGNFGSHSNYSTAIYGGNIFTKYTIVRDFPSKNMSFFVYSGYEILNLSKRFFKFPPETGRFVMQSVLVGGGLRQYLGGRSSVEILILYNLNERSPTPYQAPTIKIGINF